MMVIFLVGLVWMIFMRTLRKDYARYQKDEELDDVVCSYPLILKIFFENFGGVNIRKFKSFDFDSFEFKLDVVVVENKEFRIFLIILMFFCAILFLIFYLLEILSKDFESKPISSNFA